VQALKDTGCFDSTLVIISATARAVADPISICSRSPDKSTDLVGARRSRSRPLLPYVNAGAADRGLVVRCLTMTLR